MKTTSHFIGIELQAAIFSNLFIEVYKYCKENNMQDSIIFQNPLSPHITLYYLEKDINEITKQEIKEYIQKLNIDDAITLSWFDYFYCWEWDKNVLYLTSKTRLNLKNYRNNLHKKYNKDYVEDNNFEFVSHITFLRIQDNKVFEKHRLNIENIINKELQKISNVDINTRNISLYAVNSKFREEIQIKQ